MEQTMSSNRKTAIVVGALFISDLRIRAFIAFIKTEGAETLIDCLLRNEGRGIHYGQDRDCDGKASEEEVIWLLKAGLSY